MYTADMHALPGMMRPDLVISCEGMLEVAVAELSGYSREPAQREIDYLGSIPGFKWTKK